MAPQARLLVNDALPCARNRVLDHSKAPKTALARPLGRPNRFARPLLDQPLVWWSGKPNRSPVTGGFAVEEIIPTKREDLIN